MGTYGVLGCEKNNNNVHWTESKTISQNCDTIQTVDFMNRSIPNEYGSLFRLGVLYADS